MLRRGKNDPSGSLQRWEMFGSCIQGREAVSGRSLSSDLCHDSCRQLLASFGIAPSLSLNRAPFEGPKEMEHA
ncbi:hypothetical protein SDJN03_04587, partial [Cucurbita argyrosperma subsp. sororia]